MLLVVDEETTLDELKQEVQAFCEERDWDQFHDALRLAAFLSTESNELLDLFRHVQDDEMLDVVRERRDKIEMSLLEAVHRFVDLA